MEAPPIPPPVETARRGAEPPQAEPVRGTRGFPLPLPTSRAAACVALAAVPTLLAVWWPPFAWGTAAVLVATVVACALDWATLPEPADVECERLGSEVVPLGTDHAVAVAIRSRGAAISASVVDDLAPTLDRVTEPAPFRVEAGGGVRCATVVRGRRRGRLRLGAVHLRLRGPWGLVERAVRFDVARDVRVIPGVQSVTDAARLLRRGLRREAGLRQTRRRGEGTSFESLREYVRGDDPRKLDWKASARHGKLIARQYEVERSRTVLLLVDCGRWMTSEVGGLTRLDRVLDACVLLAHVAALRDDRVGLLAFSDRIEAYVPPVKGRAAVERIVDATLDIDPRLVESDYARAFAELDARHRKRALVVLFTDVLSTDASSIVATEMRRQTRRHAALAVTLRDPDLDAIADSVPANASAAHEQAAAEDLLLERDAALARMRRDGIHVLDTDPRRLGPALVEKYLDLKARLVI